MYHCNNEIGDKVCGAEIPEDKESQQLFHESSMCRSCYDKAMGGLYVSDMEVAFERLKSAFPKKHCTLEHQMTIYASGNEKNVYAAYTDQIDIGWGKEKPTPMKAVDDLIHTSGR